MFEIIAPIIDPIIPIIDPGPIAKFVGLDWQIGACVVLTLFVFWFVVTHKKDR